MTELITFFFFIFGLIFGSFFNVVGLRVPKKESIVFPGSHCPKCQHELAWYENIPVFSYLFLRGRCKNCSEKISPIYPVFELITGILFAFSFYQLGWSVELSFAILLVSLLVIITVSDLAYMIIPDKVLLFFLIIFVILLFFEPLSPWWDSLLGAGIGFGILYILAVVSKGGMGGGDIKLFFVIGLVLGTQATLMTLFLASILGTVFGIIQMIQKKVGRKHAIPFGPFIALGAVIAYFYTDYIISWYLHLFIG